MSHEASYANRRHFIAPQPIHRQTRVLVAGSAGHVSQSRLVRQLSATSFKIFSMRCKTVWNASRSDFSLMSLSRSGTRRAGRWRNLSARIPTIWCLCPTATTGVNTVLHSLKFKRGDQLLTTNHAYNACRCALEFVAARDGARVVMVKIPFPLASTQQVVDAVLAKVTRRTRLALLDHVTSSTGLVLPLEKIVRELSARSIETLVDGAHAPGMIPLNLKKLGAAYYAGNCHKWICSPKGAALLYVRRDRSHKSVRS